MSAPTVSVLERIALDIVQSLGDLKTANANYQNIVTDILRPNPGLGNEMVDRRLIVYQGEVVREWDCPETMTQWLQDFGVLCMVVESESSTTAIDSRLNSLATDVEQCLCLNRNPVVPIAQVDTVTLADIAPGDMFRLAITDSLGNTSSVLVGPAGGGDPISTVTDAIIGAIAASPDIAWQAVTVTALGFPTQAMTLTATVPGVAFTTTGSAVGTGTITIASVPGQAATNGGQVRSGLAEDTVLAARTPTDVDPQAHDGLVTVVVQVRYRTQYNNPLLSIYD